MKIFIPLFFIIASSTIRVYSQNYQFLNFDGVDDYVVDENSTIDLSLNSTVEIKFKRTRLNQREDLFSKKELISGPPSNNDFAFFITADNKINVMYRKTTTNQIILTSTTITNTSSWYHVATVKNGSTVQLYVNGILEASGTFNQDVTSVGPLWIGSNRTDSFSPVPFYPFQGSIDELRMWNIAKSSVEINADINNELNGNEANLINYYNFNEGIPCENNLTVNSLPNIINGDIAQLVNFDLTGNLSDTCFSNWAGVQNTSTVNEVNNYEISIFPNPCNEKVNILGAEIGSEIIIYDITGNLIYKDYLNDITVIIDISGFSKGVYLINISDNSNDKNQMTHKKLLIN